MTDKEKTLLLNDLCARLPYGIKIQVKGNLIYPLLSVNFQIREYANNIWLIDDHEVKPYLRSMESRTDEEKEIMSGIHWNAFEYHWNYIDFCNKHHLDYRGLIKKALLLKLLKVCIILNN